MADLKITTSQAPGVRAMIRSEAGELFDYTQDLATQAELDAQGIDAAPVAYSIYRSTNAFAQYAFATDNLEVLTGWDNVELTAGEVFYTPSDVEELALNFNFEFVPDSRVSQPFSTTGFYLIKCVFYPKTGAAVAFQLTIQVV